MTRKPKRNQQMRLVVNIDGVLYEDNPPPIQINSLVAGRIMLQIAIRILEKRQQARRLIELLKSRISLK